MDGVLSVVGLPVRGGWLEAENGSSHWCSPCLRDDSSLFTSGFSLSSSSSFLPALKEITACSTSSQSYFICDRPQTIVDDLSGEEAVFYKFEKEAGRGAGKEKLLHVTWNAAIQFLSISAPET